jgi:hypothetical protein
MSTGKRYEALPPGLKPRLLDRSTAAAYCGVSVSTFLKHVPVNSVPIGSKRLWDRLALDRWIEGSPTPHTRDLHGEIRRLLDDLEEPPAR